MRARTSLLLLLLGLATVAVAQYTVSGCSCDDNDNLGDGACDAADHHWRLIFPTAVTVECARNEPSVQYNNEEDEYFAARYTGYGYEQNACADLGCDDDDQESDPVAACEANDDDGRGQNAFVHWRWVPNDGDCTNARTDAPGSICDQVTTVAPCDLTQITRFFTSFTVCPCLANQRIQGTQVITEVDSTDPIVYPPPDVVIECGESTDMENTGRARAHDRCDSTPSVVATTGSPVVGACDAEQTVSTILRTFTATDFCGNDDSAVQSIVVVDTQPPIMQNVPDDVRAECAEEVLAAVDPFSFDVCAGSGVTESTTELRTQGSCVNDFVLERTYSAVDPCDNEARQTQTIVVRDTTPPTIDGFVEYQEIACRAPAAPTPMAADNCASGATLVTSTSDQPSTQSPGIRDVFHRFTATDACGNVATSTQHVRVTLSADMQLSTGSVTQSLTLAGAVYTGQISTSLALGAGSCDLQAGEVIIKFNPFPATLTGAVITGWTCTGAGLPGEVRCSNTGAITVAGGAVAFSPTLSLPATELIHTSFDVVFSIESADVLDTDPSNNSVAVTVIV